MNGVVRELSELEVTDLALPLRFEILHEECGWVRHEPTGPESLRDRFDACSLHLGFFDESKMAGTLRVVIRANVRGLPSGVFLPPYRNFRGLTGEVSKLLVKRSCRRQGVRVELISAAIERAIAGGVEHLFLATLGKTSHYRRYGFERVGRPIRFSDEHIAPPGLARMHHLNLLGAALKRAASPKL